MNTIPMRNQMVIVRVTYLCENRTVKSIDKSTLVAQGPADDDNENESHKAWTMEMLTNDGDISTSMMN